MTERTRDGLLVTAVLLGALGWWLPYVTHRNGAAALVLLGLDLGDFWKFTNEWRVAGLFASERLFFYLPPALAAMMLSLWIGHRRGAWRWLFLPLVLFLALVPLPAVDLILPQLLPGNPFVFEESGPAREYTFQLWLTVAALVMAAGVTLWGRLPPRYVWIMVALLGAAGAMLPAYGLWYTWDVLQGFYGGGAIPGPGIFLTTAGFTAVTLLAVWPVRREQEGAAP